MRPSSYTFTSRAMLSTRNTAAHVNKTKTAHAVFRFDVCAVKRPGLNARGCDLLSRVRKRVIAPGATTDAIDFRRASLVTGARSAGRRRMTASASLSSGRRKQGIQNVERGGFREMRARVVDGATLQVASQIAIADQANGLFDAVVDR